MRTLGACIAVAMGAVAALAMVEYITAYVEALAPYLVKP